MWSGSFRIRIRIKFVCNKVAVFKASILLDLLLEYISKILSIIQQHLFQATYFNCWFSDLCFGNKAYSSTDIFDDQFLFLICKCSAEEIWYFFKKEMKMTKTQVLWWKATKHVRKVHPAIAFSILNLPYWPIM